MKSEELTVGKKLELIDEVLTRSAGEFVDPDGIFRKKLIDKVMGKYDKPIHIKFGIDPTRPDIHLGHAVVFRSLRKLQIIGCKIIFLAGDFTATIGDPTGKSKVRPQVDYPEIQKNVATYIDQIDKLILIDRDEQGRIINSERFSWIRNSDWYISPADIQIDLNLLKQDFNNDDKKQKFLASVGNKDGKIENLNPNSLLIKSGLLESSYNMQKTFLNSGVLHFMTVLSLFFNLRRVTFARLIERDMFQKRIAENEPLFMHEMLYPVLQGVDSLLMAKIYGSCDLEVGGTDQTFNMLIGRDVMAGEGQAPQAVLSFKLLEGTDGIEKMSKSLDNYIAITDTPNEIFGKTMSIPDSSIVNYFELATDVPLEEIKNIEGQLKGEITSSRVNPRDLKVRLAKEIVSLYHGKDAAEKAEAYFVNTISNKQIPTDVRPSQAPPETTIIEFMVTEKLASSKSDARRKIEQGGVELDGEKVTDWKIELDESHNGKVLKVGKKDFVKIVF